MSESQQRRNRELLAERDELKAEVKRLREAIGLATTAVPSMEMDQDNPLGMMQRVVDEVEWHRVNYRTEDGNTGSIAALLAERDRLAAMVEGVWELLDLLREALAPDSPSLEMWTDSCGRVLVRRRGGNGVAAMGYNIQDRAKRDPLADALTVLVGVFQQGECGSVIVGESKLRSALTATPAPAKCSAETCGPVIGECEWTDAEGVRCHYPAAHTVGGQCRCHEHAPAKCETQAECTNCGEVIIDGLCGSCHSRWPDLASTDGGDDE